MKFFLKISAICLLMIMMLPMIASASDVERGDVNGDGRVNSADAIYLLRHTIMPGIYPLA